MIITNAKQTHDANWISLTFDNGSIGQTSVTDGIRRQHTDVYDQFIANGGVVEPEFSAQEITDKAEATRQLGIKNSVRSQIYGMYSAEDQMNMTSELAIALTDDPTGTRTVELRGVRDWIIAMVTLSRTSAADGVTLEANIVWPTHTKVSI